MNVIGLTGNIGCGKSTVASMLREWGVVTIDADEVAREVRETDPVVRRSVLAAFGTLDRDELARLAFGDPARLRELEAIVQPAVRDAVLERLGQLEATQTADVAVEAIKLLESPLRERCNAIWVVTCDEDDAVRRLATSRGLSEAEVRSRLAHQSPQTEKIEAADVVIDGSAPLAVTREQVERGLSSLTG